MGAGTFLGGLKNFSENVSFELNLEERVGFSQRTRTFEVEGRRVQEEQ